MPHGPRVAKVNRATPAPPQFPTALTQSLTAAVSAYLQNLDGHPASGLYDLVIREVEAPLLKLILEHTGGNQTQAARLLGLSRATLRKKLLDHGLV